MMEKNICYRQRRRKEVVYDDCVLEDSSSQGDWYIEEDPNVDYEMLLRGLRAWAERASKPPHDKLGSNFEDHQGIVGEKKGFEDYLLKYRQRKILEAAQRRTRLKKFRGDLRKYIIPLAALLNEDGTRTSFRHAVYRFVSHFVVAISAEVILNESQYFVTNKAKKITCPGCYVTVTLWRYEQQMLRCGDMSPGDKKGRSRSSEVDDHLLKAIIKEDSLKTT
ncbi:hypothetical protein RB195_018269 [Necator americanus]|uniref:Uncharacterized protein n=1 Tax=Necator americanus TaxID=51031 RepID=A0ABR1CA05_NECAM